jgi:signal transduction histidine kinase
VTNIGRHAEASAATVAIRVADGSCRLQVIDDGRGMAGSEPGGGLGLGNMGRRAEKLHGEFRVEDGAKGGTILTWQVPIRQ